MLGPLHALLKSFLSYLTLKHFVIVVFGLPLVIYLYREVCNDALIIDPISVPKQFEDAGLTSEAMANRIGNAIRQIESETKTKMKDKFLFSREQVAMPDVEIPGTKVGLKTLVELTRALFQISPKHICGDIVTLPVGRSSLGDVNLNVTVYVVEGKRRSQFITFMSRASEVDSLARKTAEMILRQVNPYLLAVYDTDHGQSDEAIAIASEIISDPGADRQRLSAALILLGILLQNQKKYDDAIVQYRRAIDLDPGEAASYNNWGAALMDQNKYDEAIGKYRQAIQLDSHYAVPYSNWGVALKSQEKYDEAIAKYQKAIELNPTYSSAYSNWGMVLKAQKQYGEAIAKYQKAIGLDPKDAVSYINWGAILQNQKKYDEAITKYQKAIELDPKDSAPYYNWGTILQDQMKYDEAITKYQKAVDLDPTDAAVYFNWGRALQGQKRYAQAIAKYKKAIELNPGNATPHFSWSEILQRQGKYSEAQKQFDEGTELLKSVR